MDVIVSRSEVEGVTTPPPSKSYTHRAIIAASLSGRARVENPLIAEDTIATLMACRKIGASVFRRSGELVVEGVREIECGGYFYFANSGTTLRIFTALLALNKSQLCTLDGDASLRSRPNRELAIAIRKLGGRVVGGGNFCAPFKVGGIMKGGEIEISAVSSQFVTALLMAAPLTKYGMTVRVSELKSRPYVDVTLHVLEESGIAVAEDDGYCIDPQKYRLRRFSIPADFSSASYLIAAGLLAGRVEIRNVFESRQGDARIVDICKEMGGKVRWNRSSGVLIAEKSELEGVEIDASDTPDLVPTIAVLAAAAKGETVVRNAEHLRLKEIDRIKGICVNLRSLGFEVEERRDGFRIVGRSGKFFGTVDSFGDHRMAMAFSLLGLLGEVRCRNAEVVSVSFPGFFEVLKSLGARITCSL